MLRCQALRRRRQLSRRGCCCGRLWLWLLLRLLLWGWCGGRASCSRRRLQAQHHHACVSSIQRQGRHNDTSNAALGSIPCMLGMCVPNRSHCTGHMRCHTRAGCVLELLRGSSGWHPRCTLQHAAALVLALLAPSSTQQPLVLALLIPTCGSGRPSWPYTYSTAGPWSAMPCVKSSASVVSRKLGLAARILSLQHHAAGSSKP